MEIHPLAVHWIGRETKGRHGDQSGAVALILQEGGGVRTRMVAGIDM